jgi:hypothetical protein
MKKLIASLLSLLSLVLIITGSQLTLSTAAQQKPTAQQQEVLSVQQATNAIIKDLTSPVEPLLAATSSTPVVPAGYTLQYIGQYSSVSAVSDGMIAVSTGDFIEPSGYWGFVDATTGKEVISPKYRVWYSPNPSGVYGGLRFREGRLPLNTDKGTIVIDKTGKVIVPAGRYKDITPYDNGVAGAYDDRGWHLIDKDGKEIFTSKDHIYIAYDPRITLQYGLAVVYMNEKSYVSNGVINITGKTVLPFSKTQEYMILSNGLIQVRDFSASKVSTYYVDKHGNRVTTVPDPRSAYADWEDAHRLKLSEKIKDVIKYYDYHRKDGPEYYDLTFLTDLSEQFSYITPVEDGVALVGQFVKWVYLSPYDPDALGEYSFSRPLCDWYILRPIN